MMDNCEFKVPARPRCLKREYQAVENAPQWRDDIKSIKRKLMSAVQKNDVLNVSSILRTQIHVTTYSSRKLVNRALMKACFCGHDQVASLLLTSGANANEPNEDGFSPLKAAIVSNSYATVKLLLRYGASVQSKIKRGEDSPLHVALKRGFTPDPAIGGDRWNEKMSIDSGIVYLLLENGGLITQMCSDGYLPLSLAASANRLDIVELMIRKHVDLNGVDSKYQMTPLMHASVAGHDKLVRLLLSHGADIEDSNKWDYTPLLLASQFSKHMVVSALIEQHASLAKISQFDGKDALILATESGCRQTVHTLLRHGANFRYAKPVHRRGTTALMVASKLGHSGIVECLLEFGARDDQEDEDGATAQSLCTNPDIRELLERAACSQTRGHA